MNVLSWLLDLLYPPKCLICGKLLATHTPVCQPCMDTLPEYDGAAPNVRFTQDGAVSFFYEGTLRESFLRFKFGGSRWYAKTYGAWLAHTIADRLAGRYELLTWAPVSRARRAKRGYDQSELLCKEVAKNLGCEAVSTLKRSEMPRHSRRRATRHTAGRTFPARICRKSRNALPANESCLLTIL